MPIEIKELIIRAVVDPSPTGSPAARPESSESGDGLREDRIVARCMEQLVEYLRMQQER